MIGKTTDIIPFGKYKGQPLEILQQDKGYCDWLMSQDWLQSRFPELRTLIINNFAEPSETPEHNAIQARFLDGLFVVALCRLAIGENRFPSTNLAALAGRLSVTFEQWGADVVVGGDYLERVLLHKDHDGSMFIESRSQQSFGLKHKVDRLKSELESRAHRVEYLKSGRAGLVDNEYIDSVIKERDEYAASLQQAQSQLDSLMASDWFEGFVEVPRLGVEIKPAMGDDYPAVIRQIRAMRSDLKPVLVLGAYTGVGATLKQVRAMFAASGIVVLLISEIESLMKEIQE